MFIAISFGAKEMTLETVWTAILHYNPALTTHQIIHELRLPRVIGAAVIGAAFAVSGALMQGVTRNPLADAGILGINAGAMFVVALSFAFLPNLPYSALMVLSFAGAALSALFIFLLGSSSAGGLTPLKLTIAGAVVAALLHSLSSGVAIYYDLSQDLAFWYAGGVSGVKWSHLELLVPILAVTFLGTLVLGRSISLLSLGDEVAANLGVKTRRIRALGMTAALILAGVSVSAVGSIGFVGLVIPHISRKLVGVDYRFIIPVSALLGAVLLVLADLGARMVNPPRELAIGVMVALVGVPFFLYLAHKERRSL
ncbi:FecCD family ABC transporter permease [Paenibacillus radicis (ex Xue et al. 2023)]|uniref:Iron ABC transporter permease n=1 Tax=Paenibacillus radicis (ex Xue et al. 2023) TaxID=2972489 RepID=A0ABT1YKK3_9BACL|nr:iron ABC transporter permease [Paenibacillus radicis (ex Xue et al. 2023)]MCR8633721.1 iron ABC transporter permease [Paenibacillus radicis (ex Xue et al. 2023)]